jgi:DHA2 family multidrug resistance protein
MTTISAAAPSTEGGGVNRIMITASVMMATTVIITDMTIATIALPHMQGGLSANQDQVSWVMTIYFMMQGVSMSTVGWVAGRFGRKRVFMCTLVGFVICAMLSGQAESISEIMFYRALQGMFSAPVVPISQALMLDSYPRERHSQALAIWGTGVMFAPVMAPVIGGWLTDEYSWRFVFYVSSPFAILAILGVLAFVRETPRNLERRFDWFGFVSLAMALVSLQFMLDRGQSEGWFSSDFIVCAGVLIVLGIYLFVVHSLTTDNTFISPAIFADRNLVIGLIFMFMLGILVLSMNVIMPLFLQNLRGYPILTAALVLMPRGLGTVVGLTVAGRLTSRIDPRAVIIFGFASVAGSAWILSIVTIDADITYFIAAAFLNGVGLGAIWVPLTTVSFWTLPDHLRTEASTLTSLCRNYGSGIGVSVVISVASYSRSTAHAYLAEHTSPYSDTMKAPVLPPEWDIYGAAGLRLLENEVSRQALSIGFLNDFNLLLFGALAAIPMVFLLARGKGTSNA